jgi:hypothetical protein
VTVWFLSIKVFRRVKPKMLFYLGLGAWVNGGSREEPRQMGAAAEPQPTRNIYHGGTETRRKLKGKVKNRSQKNTKNSEGCGELKKEPEHEDSANSFFAALA